MTDATTMPRLASDVHRNTVALGVAALGTIIAFFVYWAFLPIHFSLATVVTVSFVFWILYSLATAALTQITFRGVDGATLHDWLEATTPRRRAERIEAAISGTGLAVNVSWAVLAMIAVALMVAVPGLVEDPLSNGLGLGVVASSWIVTVYAYATHYARLNSSETSLDYPGDTKQPVYADYLYLSAQVATTFSSSDVSILTTTARKTVTGQTLIAFVYTSFIIAMLIGLLFR